MAGKRTPKSEIREPPPEVDPGLLVVLRNAIRVQIVAAGHVRLISPTEISEEFGLPLKWVSDQFTALVKADFLELVETVPARGFEKHLYRSTRRAALSAIDWNLLTEPIQDEVVHGFRQDLSRRLADAAEAGTINSRADRCLYWLAMQADDKSWAELVEMLAWLIEEVDRLNEETVQRHAQESLESVKSSN